MEELIKQQLNYYSNVEFSLPNHRVLNIPRYDRHSSFSEVSDWTNSNKVTYQSKLPRIYSKTDRVVEKSRNGLEQVNGSNLCCPIKQMDINLQPLKHLEESFYCQYLKKKAKKPLRQAEFCTSYEKEGRKLSVGRGTIGIAQLQDIIRRQKKSRFNVNIEDYLRTTQLCQMQAKK